MTNKPARRSITVILSCSPMCMTAPIRVGLELRNATSARCAPNSRSIKISTLPPLSFVADNLAGITLLLLTTSKSFGRHKPIMSLNCLS